MPKTPGTHAIPLGSLSLTAPTVCGEIERSFWNWFRSYGNENWEFDVDGLMRSRIASINDLPISASERKYHWRLGPRPDDHPSLSDLGL
jgi:nuclear transport factor 2 (NTF2) superfamily protein